MSIWDEPLTKDEYLRRLFEAKAEQRRKDADLPFEEKIEIVLALQDMSRSIRDGQPPDRVRAGGVDSSIHDGGTMKSR